MKTIEVERKLTSSEIQGAERIERYLNGWGNFAMIAENACIPLNAGELSEDLVKTCNTVKKKMRNVFTKHPDFLTFHMKDGHMLVLLEEKALIFDPEEMSEEEYEEKKFIKGMMLREDLFEACEKEEVLAIVDIEKCE